MSVDLRIKVGEHYLPAPKGFFPLKGVGLRNLDGWRKLEALYPNYERPDYYAHRPADAPVVLRSVDPHERNYESRVEETLSRAGLFVALDASMKRQFLSKEEFVIGIKPNWMMALKKDEPHVSTDPELVLAVINILVAQGFKRENILIFESNNMYGNFVEGHTVENVVEKLHSLDPKKMNVINLTRDVEENGTDFIRTRKMGLFPVAPTLKWINFLINMPKLKTHPSSGITMAFKNLQGLNFFADKFCFLHGNAIFKGFGYKAWFWFDPTFELNTNPELEYTKDMFAIVDAQTGLDSFGGWKSILMYFAGNEVTSPFTGESLCWSELHRPGQIIASRDPYKLEIVTMLLMNYTADQLMINPFLRSMTHAVHGLPIEIRIDNGGRSDIKPFRGFRTTGNFEPLLKTMFGRRFAKYLSGNNRLASEVVSYILTIGEGLYPVANLAGLLFSGTDEGFPLKLRGSYLTQLASDSWEKWLKRGVLDALKYRKDPNNFIYGA
jgi:hypothetical protein